MASRPTTSPSISLFGVSYTRSPPLPMTFGLFLMDAHQRSKFFHTLILLGAPHPILKEVVWENWGPRSVNYLIG